MREVHVHVRPLAALDHIARPRDLETLRSSLRLAADRMAASTLWHVNSTSEGGGVAELLHQLLGYVVEGGISCRWMVLEGTPPFFEITKRIHNRLHGSPGDGGPLGDEQHATYTEVIRNNVEGLLDQARPGDVAVLHDPQTAGLVAPLIEAGLLVVWVCHVGVDRPDQTVRSAWEFLRPEVDPAHAYVFSRRAYIWEGLRGRTAVIPPCIDPTSAKNLELPRSEVAAILGASHVLGASRHEAVRIERDGIRPVDVRRRAVVTEDAPAPSDAPLVLQVSRWDRLKDHVGVLRAFARHVHPDLGAHLLLVGPIVGSVSDDPEGASVLAENVSAWEQLPSRLRDRVHLLSLPMDDLLENALVVNALQRAADVVVQKSLAEGFGLTVAEAMWKTRPVVGSRVGGIQDQIRDGHSGLLVEPADGEGMGRAVTSLVTDPGFASAIGHAGRDRIRARSLPPHFLGAHMSLIDSLLRERVP